MLTLNIGGKEFYDEEKEMFLEQPSYILQLEHSLVSLSEWEAKWQKAFLNKKTQRTYEESIDYVRCMTLNKDVDTAVYEAINRYDLAKIIAYIDDKRSATWFSEQKKGPSSREIITSELIYYWMIANNIPIECENWHLNRLLTLIRICEVKQSPPKKMSQRDLAARNHALNKSRKAKHHTKG